MKFILLSDLHVGKFPVFETYKKNTKTIFDSIVNHYTDITEKPPIVITGDLVDDGKEEQFEYMSKQLQELRKQGFNNILLCPGNHDYGKSGIFLQKNSIRWYRQYIHDLIQPDIVINNYFPQYTQFTEDKVHFIGLDSMEGDLRSIDKKLKANNQDWVIYEDNQIIDSPGFSADGEIGLPQMNLLINKIDEIRNNKETSRDKIIVYLHHHPFFRIGSSTLRNLIMRLKDHKEFLKAVKSKIDILVFGHKHRERQFRGRRVRKYQIPVIYASGASTEWGRGFKRFKKPSYRIVDTNEMKIEKVEII